MFFMKPFAAWCALGLIGIAALAVSIDVSLFASLPDTPDVPTETLRLLAVVQPAVLMVVGVALGVGLSRRVGLRSWLTARLRGENARFPSPWMPVVAGVIGGILVAQGDLLFFRLYDGDMPANTLPGPAGAVAALAYGGIVEELMLRYGLLTLGFWVVWKLSGERPRAGAAWALIAGVAVLFGLGHLPAMAATIPLDMAITLRTVAFNAVLGVFYGWLYWRRGLEAGMMAHAATHPGLWIGLAIG
jgi:hypothetical protein